MDLTDKAGVDAVIELDFAANAALLPGVLRPRGTVVVYGTGERPTRRFPRSGCWNAIAIQFIFVYELAEDERARRGGRDHRMLDGQAPHPQRRPHAAARPSSPRTRRWKAAGRSAMSW